MLDTVLDKWAVGVYRLKGMWQVGPKLGAQVS